MKCNAGIGMSFTHFRGQQVASRNASISPEVDACLVLLHTSRWCWRHVCIPGLSLRKFTKTYDCRPDITQIKQFSGGKQGSHTFAMTKFQDISRTFQDTFSFFPGHKNTSEIKSESKTARKLKCQKPSPSSQWFHKWGPNFEAETICHNYFL